MPGMGSHSGVKVPWEWRWCQSRAGGNGVAARRGRKEARGETLHRGTRTASEAGRPGQLAKDSEARHHQEGRYVNAAVYPFERFSECAKAVITLAREKAEMIVFWPNFRSFRFCLRKSLRRSPAAAGAIRGSSPWRTLFEQTDRA